MARLRRAVVELHGDQHGLEGPQRSKGHRCDQGKPDYEFEPDRPVERQLCVEQPAAADGPDDQQDEDHGSVAGIGFGEIDTASFASIEDFQVAVEQWSFTAVGTAAQQTGHQGVHAGHRRLQVPLAGDGWDGSVLESSRLAGRGERVIETSKNLITAPPSWYMVY